MSNELGGPKPKVHTSKAVTKEGVNKTVDAMHAKTSPGARAAAGLKQIGQNSLEIVKQARAEKWSAEQVLSAVEGGFQNMVENAEAFGQGVDDPRLAEKL